MKRSISRILALYLILALCLSCGAQAFADAKDSLKKKATAQNEAAAVVKEVKKLMDDGKMYDAALACYDGYYEYTDAQDEFNALWDKIADACADKMPKTGELERTFKYQGGNELHVTAVSGNVEMTAVDRSTKELVRAFIREGETIVLNVPAGTFDVSYKLGDIWFDDKLGFGEFCADYPDEDTLDIKYTSEGGWVTYYTYSWEV